MKLPRTYDLLTGDIILHIPEVNRRKARCQGCNRTIPKGVPRIKFHKSWNYYHGYYCIECGVALLKKYIANAEEQVDSWLKKKRHIKEMYTQFIELNKDKNIKEKWILEDL